MRRLILRLTLLGLAPLWAGCSSPLDAGADGAPVVDAMNASDVSDLATDAPAAEASGLDAPRDTSPDRVELDAPVNCGATTCAAGQVCTHEKGGVDASPVEDHCYAVPDQCRGLPACSCITSVSFRCGMTCEQTGEREFRCSGA